MRLRSFFFLAFLAPALGAPAPEPRAPARGWDVNFADAQCLATREYGTPQDPLQLVLKSPALGGVMQIAVVRRGSPMRPVQLIATAAIDERAPFEASMLAYSPKDSGLRVYTMNMAALDFAPLREARQLSVQADELRERFSLSHMTPLLKIVDDCVADLRRVFNITDPETGTASPLQRRAAAKTSLASIFSNNDYPGAALQRDQTGKVKFALLIDETGRVADCSVIETSGVAVLDAQACVIVKTRAQFQPAIGPDGKPARDAITSRVVWNIEG